MKKYLLITFIWTWGFWILSFVLAKYLNVEIGLYSSIFENFTKRSGLELFVNIIFSLAVYGPVIGFLLSQKSKDFQFFGKNDWKTLGLILVIPLLINLPTFLLSFFAKVEIKDSLTPFLVFVSIFTYMISNFLTSGTEEFGWRGFLYPHLKKNEKNFWDVTWKGGLIWAVWHFPMVIYMYWNSGPAILIPSLIGFTASIVGMAYITNWFYEKTNSLLIVMILHAMNNTVSFAVLLVFPNNQFTIIANILIWAAVWFLDKNEQKIIQTNSAENKLATN